MDQDNSELLKLYQNLPELSQNVINVLVVKFSGVPKYAVGRFFQDKLENNITQREYENVLGRLVKMIGDIIAAVMMFVCLNDFVVP